MLEDIEFKIYTKNKGLHLSYDIIVYPFFLLSIGIAWFGRDYLNRDFIEKTGQYLGILSLVTAIILMIMRPFTKKPLNGKLNRLLILKKDKILINNDEYALKEIKKIEFYLLDYDGKKEWLHYGRYSLEPGLSNGTGNICHIILQSGQEIRVRFQLNYKNEFRKTDQHLIHYYTEGKIHFLKLIEYLDISEYEAIQDFKATLPEVKI